MDTYVARLYFSPVPFTGVNDYSNLVLSFPFMLLKFLHSYLSISSI